MKELDDKHIDALMQEAAGNFAPEFNAAAWEQMQSALQSEGLLIDSKTQVHPIFKYLSVIVLFILFTGGLFYYFNSTTSTVESGYETEMNNVSPLDTNEASDNQASNGTPIADSDAPAVNDQILQDQSLIDDMHQPTRSDDLTEHTMLKATVENTSGSSDESLIIHEKDMNQSKEDTEQASQFDGLIPMSNDSNNDTTLILLPDSTYSVASGEYFVLSLGRVNGLHIEPEGLKAMEIQPEIVEITEVEESIIPHTKSRKWAVSALFSPDYSGASITKMKGTGIDLGVLVEYYILPNFSINTGGIYSTKKYFVDDGFEGYTARWPNRSEPQEIDASCSVIDIPINLRYYVRNNEKTRLFLTLGISSYIMLNEDYTYIYYNSSDWNVHIENENKHYFGLLNFSFGIQKKLKEGLYLIGEPHFKSPLTGIGAGEVNLQSTGFIISLKKEF